MNLSQTRKEVIYTALGMILLFAMAISVPQLAYIEGLENFNPMYIINITLDTFGMFVGCIVLLGLCLDKQKKGKTTRFLVLIILVTYISLLTDAVEYIYDGMAEYRLHNIWVTTLYYFTLPAEGIFFWYYTLNYLKIKNQKLIQINRLVNIGFAIAILIRIINLKYGFYFVIDEMGIYHRGAQYALSKAYFVISMMLSLAIIIAKRKQFKPVQLIAVFLYAIAPVGVGLSSLVVHGLSLSPITTMAVVLFMYCALNVTQGREIAVAENEMAIASKIQENMLPKSFPYLPGKKEFDLYAVMRPAKEVGGDFYDYFMVDDEHLALVMADVSGKGIPAALFMMTSRTLLKNRIQAGDRLSTIMRDVNNQLCEGNVADLYIIAWVGIIELGTGKGIEVNAGTMNRAIKRANGQYELVEFPSDLAIAISAGNEYHEHPFNLNAGDSIFVFTDGVAKDMENSNDMIYSNKCLVEILNTVSEASPKETVDVVLQSIDDYANDPDQLDDITMLCMKYNGPE